MSTQIATKIAEHKAKPVSLTRREKAANKDTVQKKASVHEDKAISALAGLLTDRRAPATAKARAADILLDRIAGKAAKPEDEQRPEDAYTRMSEGQLLASICESLWSLSSEARATIPEALVMAEQGIKPEFHGMAKDFDEEAAQRVKLELPPLVREAKPRKEPRR